MQALAVNPIGLQYRCSKYRGQQKPATIPHISYRKDGGQQWHDQIKLHLDLKRPRNNVEGADASIDEIVAIEETRHKMRQQFGRRHMIDNYQQNGTDD